MNKKRWVTMAPMKSRRNSSKIKACSSHNHSLYIENEVL